MLRRTCAVIGVLALTGTLSATVSGAAVGVEEDSLYPSKDSPAIDVRSYALDLTWQAGAKKLVGKATIRVAAVRGAASFSLDLHPG